MLEENEIKKAGTAKEAEKLKEESITEADAVDVEDVDVDAVKQEYVKPKRKRRKPEPSVVVFEARRTFIWHGEELVAGQQYEWDEDQFNEMMVDLSARRDRLKFVERS